MLATLPDNALVADSTTTKPYSVASLIMACGFLHHSAQTFLDDVRADQALIRSGFCPRHHVHVDRNGQATVDGFVHEQVWLLLQHNASLHFALHEMLMQFGPDACNDTLAGIIVRGLRGVQDWQAACQCLAEMRRGPARA